MGNGDYGYSQAFNIRTNHGQAINNEIEDMKYAEGQRKQNEAMAMAKSKMMQDDFEFQNGSNEYDAAIIKQEAQKAISEVGAMYKDPRAYTDPAFGLQIKLKKQSIKNTPATLRSAAWKQAAADYGKFATEALKNPTAYNLDQLKEFRTKMDNYGKDANGNPMPESEMQALVFTPPEEIPDFDKMHLDVSKTLKPTDYKAWKNGNIGAMMGTVPDEIMANEARQLYSAHKSAYDYRYKGEDPLPHIFNALKTGAPVDPHFGEVDDFWQKKRLLDYENGLKQAVITKPESAYEDQFLNKDSGSPGAKILEGVYTSTPANYYLDVNGNKVKNTDADFNYNGDFSDQGILAGGNKRTGTKIATGYIEHTPKWAEERGYIRNGKVAKGQENKGRLVEDKDGKEYFKLYSTAIIDGRATVYKQRFDNGMAPKLRANAGVSSNLDDGSGSNSDIGTIVTDKKTGKSYRTVEGGYEPLN